MIQQSPCNLFVLCYDSIVTIEINDAHIQQKQLIAPTTTNPIVIKDRYQTVRV